MPRLQLGPAGGYQDSDGKEIPMRNKSTLACFVLVVVFWGTPVFSGNDCEGYERSLKWLGTWNFQEFYRTCSLEVEWPLVYVGHDQGIGVLDLGNLPEIQFTPLLELPIQHLEKSGGVGLAVSDNQDNSIFAIDFSNPTHPAVVDTLELDIPLGWDFVNSVEIWEGRAYVGTYNHGVQILDISDLSNMRTTAVIPNEDFSMVAIHDGVLYVGTRRALKVMDLDNPDNPSLLKVYAGCHPNPLANDGMLVVSDFGMRTVYDLANPRNPVPLLRETDLGYHEPYAGVSQDFVAGMKHSRKLEITPLRPLSQRSQVLEVGNSWVEGYILEFADAFLIQVHFNNMAVYELGSGQEVSGGPPAWVGPEARLSDVVVMDGIAFGVGWDMGLMAWRIEDDGGLEPILDTQDFGSFKAVEVHGNHLLAANALETIVLDVSEPTSPVPVGYLPEGGDGHQKYEVHGDRLFIGYWGFISIFDISDPTNIQFRDEIVIGEYEDFAVDGDRFYSGGGYNNPNIFIHDLGTVPATQLGSFPANTHIEEISADQDLLALNIGWYEHRFMDVADPAACEQLGTARTWSWGPSRILGNRVLIADEFSLRFHEFDADSGLANQGMFWFPELEGFEPLADGQILVWGDHSLQVAPAPCSWTEYPPAGTPQPTGLLSASPNPFNPQTMLAFDLPQAGPVHLAVHDLRGRRIAVLCEDDLPAGRREFPWDGHDAAGRIVPSGVYFARLEHNQGGEAIKLVLLK